MTIPTLTDPQRRALLWLKPDCGDCTADRSVSAALCSLVLYHRDLVTSHWRKTPRGRNYLAYTLTEAGVRVRAEMVALANVGRAAQ